MLFGLAVATGDGLLCVLLRKSRRAMLVGLAVATGDGHLRKSRRAMLVGLGLGIDRIRQIIHV